MKNIALALVATTAALGMGLVPITPAAAQQNPNYCGGKLQAASFYSTVNSNSRTSTVHYFLVLQNTTAEPATYAVTFNAQQSQNRPNGTQFSSLGPWGTATVALGQDRFNNPGGTGALSTVYDLPPATRVACR
ncbi:MAG: hypothetical protein JWR10_2318 [Rubritepida sp.]|nr:hypothetical protein [Rubritepida sp.]